MNEQTDTSNVNQWISSHVSQLISATLPNTYVQVAGISNGFAYTVGPNVTPDEVSGEKVEGTSVSKKKSFPVPSPKEIGIGLYFRYVKKGIGKLQEQKLKARLERLQLIRLNAEKADQQGLLEASETLLLVTAREQILLTKGYDKYLLRDRVTKYINFVKNIHLTQITNFPRPLPKSVASKLAHVKALGVFDNFEILYSDYTKAPVAKSTSEKVRDKDPILFGTMIGVPENLYYITDWVDEYCDLTLEKLLGQMKRDGFESDPSLILDINDEKTLNDLKSRVLARSQAIASTNVENWRETERAAIRAEEKAKLEREMPIKNRGFFGEFFCDMKNLFSFKQK